MSGNDTYEAVIRSPCLPAQTTYCLTNEGLPQCLSLLLTRRHMNKQIYEIFWRKGLHACIKRGLLGESYDEISENLLTDMGCRCLQSLWGFMVVPLEERIRWDAVEMHAHRSRLIGLDWMHRLADSLDSLAGTRTKGIPRSRRVAAARSIKSSLSLSSFLASFLKLSWLGALLSPCAQEMAPVERSLFKASFEGTSGTGLSWIGISVLWRALVKNLSWISYM